VTEQNDDAGSSSKPLPEPSPVEHGGRVELRLDLSSTGDSGEARYEARWFTPGETHEGVVSVEPGVRPVVNVEAPDSLPKWLASFTSTLVSTTARKVSVESPWPRRLTRWRADPKE
jgi:hypothetical protein